MKMLSCYSPVSLLLKKNIVTWLGTTLEVSVPRVLNPSLPTCWLYWVPTNPFRSFTGYRHGMERNSKQGPSVLTARANR